ncbi:HAD-IIIA family hydrolase [Paraburkholderia acidisoli]|uniref:D,D-heptose 1,7-bisphosphate phosphatase n=2 Tax=Paraburkholderia acidisoli TaxID=2571748 RepID=A0A7Z2JHW0_9BURK|nr:HAD-IIIA family hydrolase [Paraburkholderia acidisoli]
MRSARAQWPAVFLDINGALIHDSWHRDNHADPARMRLAPGAAEALERLAQAPLRLVIVSHQRDVSLDKMETQLQRLFARCGARLHAAYWCPHDSHDLHDPRGALATYAGACTCRKPQPGMLLRAQREHDIDLSQSWLIGEHANDIEAGNRAGCRSILTDGGNEAAWHSEPARLPYAIVTNLHDAAQMIVERHAYEHAEPAPEVTGTHFA